MSDEKRYTFIRKVGEGGQGVVSLYKDTLSENNVVIKSCENLHGDARKRFLREIQIMEKFQHPNLVKYLGFCAQPYGIVMEYLPGGSLRDKIDRLGRIPWPQASKIVLELIQGLKLLHSEQIVHRDIKPENILFTEEGRCKLGDFGVVTSDTFFVDKITAPTSMVFKPGTLAYNPPEFFGADFDCDPRSDVYSLGVTLYEMLTGKHPFLPEHTNRANIVDLILAINQQEIISPEILVKELPQELVALTHKMMARKMTNRFASVIAVQKALEKIDPLLDLEPVSASQKTDVVSDDTEYDQLAETTDPLLLLEQEFNQEKIIWAQEGQSSSPSPQQLQYFHDITSSLGIMPDWRRRRAQVTLLKFCLKYGKWQEACELSSGLHERDEVFHQHLSMVNKRIHSKGYLPQKWLQKEQKRLQKRAWPEREFHCQKCHKQFASNDIYEHRIFFLPAVYCRDCLLEGNQTVDFAGYKLIKGPVAKDTIGLYFLALSEEYKPYLVHQVPWQRQKLSRTAAHNIIERYKRGIRLASKLRGVPWLLPINNPIPIEDRQFTYFFLDYRPSRKLIHYLGTFSPKQKNSFYLSKAYLLVEILRALEVLQAAGAIHRYVSPHDINIDVSGRIWVGGFTLAKFDDFSDEDWVEVTEDLSGICIGNPYYMAPEQFKGAKYAHHRSDLWSFAAVAYRILTGNPLFKENRRQIRQARSKKLRFVPIKEAVENIPASFSELIEKCLEENPAWRPVGASELLTGVAVQIQEFYAFMEKKRSK